MRVGMGILTFKLAKSMRRWGGGCISDNLKFLATDCHEGIRTCDLWVSVLIGSYRRAIFGVILKFQGRGKRFLVGGPFPPGRALFRT